MRFGRGWLSLNGLLYRSGTVTIVGASVVWLDFLWKLFKGPVIS